MWIDDGEPDGPAATRVSSLRRTSSGARAAVGRSNAQTQAEGFDDEAEAREAGVAAFGEGSVEGFAVEAAGLGELGHAALGVDDVTEADEEDFVAFFEAGGEVVGRLRWVLEAREE
jgi:hypothetical protein